MNRSETLKLASVEDEMWYFKALHARVREALAEGGLCSGGVVLDAGCGTGGLIKRIQGWRPELRWTGIDLNEEAVELARARAGDSPVEWRVGSVTELPWAGHVFDAVLSMDVLYHVEDDALALGEFFRVLRPGGFLCLNVPAHPWLWSYHDTATSALRRYERRALVQLVREAGFEVLNCTHWNTFLLPIIAFRRKVLPPPQGGSDVSTYPPFLDALLTSVLSVERYLNRLGCNFSAGSSLWVTARRPIGTETGLTQCDALN
jgi:SAM-dependent methyltransferase